MRVCVFIDGSNFLHACRQNIGRTDVNMGAFAELLVGTDAGPRACLLLQLPVAARG
jgi:hypothetical protein